MTYAEQSIAITVVPGSRRRASAKATTRPALTSTPAAVATSGPDSTREGSESSRTVTSRAGLAT